MGEVSTQYGRCFDEFEQQEAVSERALVVIDADERITYFWNADDTTTGIDIDVLYDPRVKVDAFP